MKKIDRKNAFKLLGIAETDDQTEIRRAWRALARTYHPDLAKTDRAAANQKLVEINAAFDLLMAGHRDRARNIADEAEQKARAARRAKAAQMAEERRQSQARQAAAERRAYEEDLLRRAREKARQRQASQSKPPSRALIAPSNPEPDAETLRAQNRMVRQAIRAFSSAMRLIAPGKPAPDHDIVA